MVCACGLVHLDPFGRNEQLPAVGHGVPRVDHQVEQHLFQHARVGLDERQARRITAFQADILADDALEHLGQVRDQIIERHRLGLHLLFAAENEQLPGQVGGAFSGADDMRHDIPWLRR